MPNEELPRWLTAEQFAEQMQLHRKTCYRKMRAGEVPGAKKVGGTWRIPRWAIDEMGTPAHLEYA